MKSIYLLFSLLSTVSAQNAAAAPVCSEIVGSAECAPFGTFSAEGKLTSTAIFDNFVFISYDTNSSYIDYFKTAHDCPNYDGIGQRYHVSMLCATIIDASASQGCKSGEQSELKLCRDVVQIALDSLNYIYGQSSICTPGAKTPGRTEALQLYTQYLSGIPEDQTECIAGIPEDLSTCGFRNLDIATSYCAQPGNQDPCCPFVGQSDVPTTKNLEAKKEESEAAPTGDTLGMGLIAGIVIGGVVGLLAISFLIYKAFSNKEDSPNTIAKNNYNTTYSTDPVAAGGFAAAAGGDMGDGAPVNETMQVIFNYVPNLSDEVHLYVGDPIIIKCKFDDGWALGYNINTKQEGSFPLACVAEYTEEDQPRYTDSALLTQRASSLYIPK